MKLFDRPDRMRHRWEEKMIRGRVERVLKINPNDTRHWMTANLKSQADMLGRYLSLGVDDTLDRQPFLPKKPYLVGRSSSARGCAVNAMEMRYLIEDGFNLHHMTVRSLSWVYNFCDIDESWDYYEFESYTWYLYGGELMRIPLSERDKIRAIDAIYLASPEVRKAMSMHHP